MSLLLNCPISPEYSFESFQNFSENLQLQNGSCGK